MFTCQIGYIGEILESDHLRQIIYALRHDARKLEKNEYLTYKIYKDDVLLYDGILVFGYLWITANNTIHHI